MNTNNKSARVFDEKAFNYFFLLEGNSYTDVLKKIDQSIGEGSCLNTVRDIIKEMQDTFTNCFDSYNTSTIDLIQAEIKKYNILIESNKNKLQCCKESTNLSKSTHKYIAYDLFYESIINLYNYMIFKIK